MTTDSLSQTPRWQRWGYCAIFALTLSGIAPAIAASAAIAACDALGGWLAVPMLAASFLLAFKVVTA